MNKQRILTITAIILSVFVLILMGYTLLYIVTNVPAIEDRIRRQVSLDIAGIKVPATIEGKDGKDGETIVGKDGYTPPCYYKIDMCQGKDGYTPVKNIDYFDGNPGNDGMNGFNAYQLWLANGNTGTFEDFQEAFRGYPGNDGQPGVPGRTLEQRCVELEPRSRIEQKYTDTEMWEVLYYLAVGQECEVPNE